MQIYVKGGDFVSIKTLSDELDEAILAFKQNAKDTCDVTADPEVKKAIMNLSDDVGHCFVDFRSAIINEFKKLEK